MIANRMTASSGRFGYLRLMRVVRGFRTGASGTSQGGSLAAACAQRPSGRYLPAARGVLGRLA